MTLVYVAIPFGWAILIKKLSLKEFGIRKEKLLLSIILGCGVYSIALIAFLVSLGNPEFDRYFRWGAEYSASDWMLTFILVSWMAFHKD